MQAQCRGSGVPFQYFDRPTPVLGRITDRVTVWATSQSRPGMIFFAPPPRPLRRCSSEFQFLAPKPRMMAVKHGSLPSQRPGPERAKLAGKLPPCPVHSFQPLMPYSYAVRTWPYRYRPICTSSLGIQIQVSRYPPSGSCQHRLAPSLPTQPTLAAGCPLGSLLLLRVVFSLLLSCFFLFLPSIISYHPISLAIYSLLIYFRILHCLTPLSSIKASSPYTLAVSSRFKTNSCFS